MTETNIPILKVIPRAEFEASPVGKELLRLEPLFADVHPFLAPHFDDGRPHICQRAVGAKDFAAWYTLGGRKSYGNAFTLDVTLGNGFGEDWKDKIGTDKNEIAAGFLVIQDRPEAVVMIFASRFGCDDETLAQAGPDIDQFWEELNRYVEGIQRGIVFNLLEVKRETLTRSKEGMSHMAEIHYQLNRDLAAPDGPASRSIRYTARAPYDGPQTFDIERKDLNRPRIMPPGPKMYS